MATIGQRMTRGLAGVVVVAVLLFVVYTLAALNWSYSSGERAGYLQKLSRKGLLCKTWEGELQLVAVPGSTPEKFLFTVRDEALVARLNAEMGKRVALTYEQHLGLPSSCFGDTGYFVGAVRSIE